MAVCPYCSAPLPVPTSSMCSNCGAILSVGAGDAVPPPPERDGERTGQEETGQDETEQGQAEQETTGGHHASDTGGFTHPPDPRELGTTERGSGWCRRSRRRRDRC